jgi:hypothetical protein
MSETERALATLQDLLDNSIFTSRIDFALEVAIEALREKLERKKGCRYCQDKSYKQKGYYIDDPAAEIVGINHYCMNCGAKMEDTP